jgi:DNA repair exonuclease SbcCD ATPase subunit
MIVEELRLRSWRSYRGERRFTFSPGVNLVIGPNEAGKSTLFEALQRALFDRHGSRARRLQSVRPLGSSLGPEVELVLRTGGDRHRVRKRFLVEPESELYRERDGRWELDHEGDRADAALRDLLGGRVASKGSEARHRGLAQALWYLQREEGLPAKAWSDAVHQGLASLLRSALREPREERVTARILALRDASFTTTGRLKASSALAGLRAEVERLEGDLVSRRTELERAEQYRQEVAELEAARGASQERLESNRREGERLAAAADRWAELEQERERLERSAEAATLRSRTLGEAWEGLLRREERLQELEPQLVASREAEAELQVEVRRYRRTAESHARHWEAVLEPRLKVLTSQIEELQARLRLDDLEREATRLRAARERRRTLAAGERSVGQALASLVAPQLEERRRLVRCAEAVALLRARIAASAVRLRFELEGSPAVASEPAVESESGEYLVTAATTFTVEGLGRIHVRSGDTSLESAARELESRSDELAAGLCRFGVDDLAGLEAKADERGRLEERRRDLLCRLADLDAADPGVEERLREVERELRHLRQRSPQQVLPGIEGWARERTLEELRDLETARERLEESIRDERRAEHEAQASCLRKDEELREAGKSGERVGAARDALREQIGEVVGPHGSRDGLRRERDEANARLLAAREELREFAAGYRQQVERPRERLAQLQSSLDGAQRELGRLEAEIADRLARLDEIAQLGLYTEVGDLEARLEVRRQRLALAEEEAEAARLLADLLEGFQGDEARELQEPLLRILDPWLRFLTGERYDALALDGELLPVAARSRRYGESLPLDSLSYGTQEQVVVLLRLAMGVLLSGEERQLVVLDDRLVNADAVRMERLCRILEEAGQRCQILLATCSAAPYASLDATTVRLETADDDAMPATVDEAVARRAEP